MIQSLYIIVFGLILSRKGFQWNWFLPLAGLFLILTLLTDPVIGGRFLPGAVPRSGDRWDLVSAPMLLIFYPLHAFVTVAVARRLPQNITGIESTLIRAVVYIGAAMAAGLLWTILMILIMLPFVSFR